MAVVALAVGILHLGDTAYLFLGSAVAMAVYVPVVWPLRQLARPQRAAEPEPAPVPQPAGVT
jgi:hypothetical protein